MGEAAASARELGDLFEYKLKDRVTLKKNQSALVPIAQTEIEAEKISLWNGTARSGRPLRGLWLKNTSPLTFDGGSFSVLENEVFAGEGLTDHIKPGERRLISYATDLGLLVEAQKESAPQHVTRVKISKGVLMQVSELHERTLSSNYALSDINEDQIGVFIKQGAITPEMVEALKKITAQKSVVAKLEGQMENRQKDIDRIVEDQGRLRENMKALRGSAEEKALLQRYTKQLDEQETQLDVLRKKIRETEGQRDKANEQLDKMIDELQIEATL